MARYRPRVTRYDHIPVEQLIRRAMKIKGGFMLKVELTTEEVLDAMTTYLRDRIKNCQPVEMLEFNDSDDCWTATFGAQAKSDG